MEVYGTKIDRMDKAALQLVEIANSVRITEYRANAIDVAKSAGDIHAAFESMPNLWDKRLRYQVDFLQDIVLDGGKLRVTPISRVRLEEIKTINEQMEEAARRYSQASRKLKDTFSALKGKSKMKEYPAEQDLAERRQNKAEEQEK
jgi:hypothetical protein